MPSSYITPVCPPTKCCDCLPDCVIPITSSCPAWDMDGPVMLSQGLLGFSMSLLPTSSIGTGGFCFGLNYLPADPNCTSSDGSVGTSVNFTQNSLMVEGSLKLQTGENTQESFADIGAGKYSSAANNTSAVVTRTGKGTPADEITVTSRNGVVSRFWGTHASIATPGRLKTLTDRFGNTQSHNWELKGGKSRLSSVTDSYGRTSTFTYDASQNYRMTRVVDYLGRRVDLQYDSAGRLVAVVGPSITQGANADANTFPNGTAYVYQYDTGNARPARRNDLIKIWYPNQVAPFINGSRVVDVASVYASATPRRQFSYYNDPTDTYHYGKVQQVTESSSGSGSIGAGAWGYLYLNSSLPSNLIDPTDPIVSRTIVTDRNGNQRIYDFNARQLVVRHEAFATRGKNSLEAGSWVTWTKYNAHNQPTLVVMPEGNSVENEYEDETNTIQFGGVPYGRRIGLLKRTTRKPGNTIGVPSRPGSGPAGAVQTQLTNRYFNDPIFNHTCASIEERGNPIDSGALYFPPQNGGTTPTNADRSRYATITYYDYQKDAAATVQGDAILQAQLGLTSTQIGQLITFVSNQMSATGGTGGLPAGFEMGIGDVNGEGTGAGTSANARHQGSVVKVKHPAVRQLAPNTGGGTPWVWQTQDRIELYTSNARGQQTTATDAEGNLTVYVRYPENDPEGGGQYIVPTLSNQQYGFLKEVHVDADPASVMSLVGSDGDMTTFIGNKIARTNTPGVYQDLVTRYQGGGGGGCSSCGAYDQLGNPLSTTDPRGFTTTFSRNELGELYRTTTDAPYRQRTEMYFDANRNVIRTDVEDRQVQYDSTDPSDPSYGKFTPTGSGSVANLPTTAGPGGAVRPGWFTNLYSFDLLDQKIEEDLDATGSSPSSLVSTYAYDGNQNLVTVIKPMGNLEEYDYDERDLRIATRVGYDPAHGNPGAVTVMAYDGNGNVIDVVGPMQRGMASQSLSVVIDDAFRSGTALTHVGDWVAQNTYDGFDRMTQGTDAVGGTMQSTYDPRSRAVGGTVLGAVGGASPTDRLGTNNVLLGIRSRRSDEAGRIYEDQRDVFLNTGKSGGSPTHALPSGRAVTHTGGGLAANDTANSHTGTVTLTTGGSSYVMSRMVYDRASRTTATATDNTALTTTTYDGANRQLSTTDPLGNSTQNTYDANGNVVGTIRIDKCTLGGAIPTETFASAMSYDLLNRPIVMAGQGPDGVLDPTINSCCAPIVPPATANQTLFTISGYDSRGNMTSLVDPKDNTSVRVYDGAGRQLQSRQHLRVGGSGNASIYDTVITTNQYDGNSRLIRLVDDNGGTSTWTYDTLDRQTVMTFHDGSTRTSSYNLASNITGYVDENGSSFAYSYDAVGRRMACTITLATGVVGTTAQSFQYDGQARRTFTRDSVSATNTDTAMVFDSLGRVPEEGQTYAADTRYVTQDKWTSLPATELTFPSGRQVSSAYDALYRRNGITEISGGTSIAAWQFFGNRTALIALGNSLTASFMNNAQNRSAVQSGQTTPGWGDKTTDRLGYDGSGRLIAKRYLPTASTTSLVGFTTAYDASSNKRFERALNAESRSDLYPSYDSMNRLLKYQRGALASGGGSISAATTLPGVNSDRTYNLDGLGNWQNTAYVPVGGAAATESRQHNKLNEVTRFGVAPASTPVLYDHGNNSGATAARGNGNITDDGTRTFSYDALNRLTTVKRKSDGATVAQYVYDAMGRRVRKAVSNGGVTGTVANTTSRYISSGSQIVEELDGSNATVRQFIWGQYIDELIQIKTLVSTGSQPLAAGNYYPLQDLLYRTTALTNGSAAVVEAYDTDAYGNTLIYKGPGADGIWFTDDDVRADQPACETIFTGRQYDPETQIYYYRARYYHPGLGRFIGRDPLILELNPNLYEYVDSSPVSRFDYSGLRATETTTPPAPPPSPDTTIYVKDCSKATKPKHLTVTAGSTLSGGDISLGDTTIDGVVAAIQKQMKKCDCLDRLVFNVHGSPDEFALASGNYNANLGGASTDVTTHSGGLFANKLHDNVCFCNPCHIFLGGCNIGLNGHGGIGTLGAIIADTTNCVVVAPQGYVTGIEPEDWQISPTTPHYPTYRGSHDATTIWFPDPCRP